MKHEKKLVYKLYTIDRHRVLGQVWAMFTQLYHAMHIRTKG
jgi:hypothetical protein